MNLFCGNRVKKVAVEAHLNRQRFEEVRGSRFVDSQASGSHHQRMRSVCHSEQQQKERHSATNTAANNNGNTSVPQHPPRRLLLVYLS